MRKTARKPVVQGVRDMLCGRIEAARAVLENPQTVDDEAVHTARKHLKGARAGLRLLRKIVGDRRYASANGKLRDAARPLSRVRDATVLIQTTEELFTEELNPGVRRLLAHLQQSLKYEHHALRGQLHDGSLKPVLATLARVERDIARWSLGDIKDGMIEDIQRQYRKSRNAMKDARHEQTDDALHEARKQAKYLANALEVLGVIGARHVAKPIERAKALGEDLGLDHDLVLIEAKLSNTPQQQRIASATLAKALQKRRKKLQRKAFRIATRLHEQKPRAFATALGI